MFNSSIENCQPEQETGSDMQPIEPPSSHHSTKPLVVGSTDTVGEIGGINRVHHLNFLNNNLPDKCANLIIADPPYFEVKGAFDFVWKDMKEYLLDVEKWAKECKRLLADNGTLFWYGHARNIAYAQVIFDMHFNLINNLVWNKGDFMGLEESEGLRSFAPCTERILMYGARTETYHTELGLINNDFENYLPIRNWIKSEREKIPHSLIYLNKHIFGYDNGKDGVAGNKLSPFKANWQFPDKENYNKIKDWCFKNNYDAFQKPYEELREYLLDVEKWAKECKRLLADNGTLFWYGHAINIAYAQVIFDMHFNLINNLVWNKGEFMGLEEGEGLRSFAPCTERILM